MNFVLDIVISVTCIFFCFYLIKSKSRFSRLGPKYFLWILYGYHVVFGLIFYWYIQNNVNDNQAYWGRPKTYTFEYVLGVFEFKSGFGTKFMYFINYVPSNIFDLSLETGFLIYNSLSFWALVTLYVLLNRTLRSKPILARINILPYSFLLPNLHFWTAGVGKDTLVFSCLVFIILAIHRNKFLSIGFLLASFVCFFIRPHIYFILVLGYGLGYILDKERKWHLKLFLSIGVTLLGFIAMPLVMKYVGISDLALTTIVERLGDQAEALRVSDTTAGTSLDFSAYPIYLKFFTFLFRPLFESLVNFLAVIVSFENLIFLILFLLMFFFKPINSLIRAPLLPKGAVLFFVLGTIAFSFSISNLGLALRMKNMLMPAFIIYSLWVLSERHYSFRVKKK